MFLDFEETSDGAGFTIIQTGKNLIYPYDEFDGWYDRKGNYYLYKDGKVRAAERPLYSHKEGWKRYKPYHN